MVQHSVRRLLAIAAMAAPIVACGMSGSDSNTTAAPFTPDIQVISDAIAGAAKYPTSSVELTSWAPPAVGGIPKT